MFSGVALLGSYFLGYSALFLLLRFNNCYLPNLIFIFKRNNKPRQPNLFTKVCTICGNVKCKRHRADVNIHILKPWTDLYITRDVDSALEEILNLTLDRYIYSWYKDITTDEFFVEELRVSLRYLFSTLLKRAKQVDFVSLITGRVAKAALQHLDCFLRGRGTTKFGNDVEQAVINYYGESLHIALRSREHEVRYLRQLTERVLPYVVPHKYHHCRSACTLVREILCTSVFLPSMDIVADPDVINGLLVIFFDKTPMTVYPDTTEPKVELLESFVTKYAPENNSVLQVNLHTIMTDQTVLFPFMQFIKEEGAVNILQFCLSVDDFNRHVLNPDLTPRQIENLHKQAQSLYTTYFAPGAVDQIKFDDTIVEEIRDIISGKPEDVIKLRTTTPLFKAYDHAYVLLEQTFCPMFYQSDRYFKLICGERWSKLGQSLAKGNRRGSAEVSHSTVSRLGSRLKGVLWANTDEGHLFEEDMAMELGETALEDEFIATCHTEGYKLEDNSRLKDLSAWRVSITRVDTRMDINCKYYYVYIVDIQRIDVWEQDQPEDLHWTVERKYNEFYVLEAKLTEFHGEIADIHLPPKRNFGNKNKQFLESRKQAFEKYLQNLLTVPSLRGSELLYRFLKSPREFTTGLFPDISFGKMIKTVPMKLIKEKGQHLDPFLLAFVASTEGPKTKASKLEWKDVFEPPTPDPGERLYNPMYGDNCGRSPMKYVVGPQTDAVDGLHRFQTFSLEGVYDYLLYLVIRVYAAPGWLARGLIVLKGLIGQTIEAFIDWYLEVKLQQALEPQRITEVLNLLRDVLFFDNEPPRTKKQKEERASLLMQRANEFLPDCVVNILGKQAHSDGTSLLLSALAHPLLNKQLSYVLLDILVQELFPEVTGDFSPLSP